MISTTWVSVFDVWMRASFFGLQASSLSSITRSANTCFPSKHIAASAAQHHWRFPNVSLLRALNRFARCHPEFCP